MTSIIAIWYKFKYSMHATLNVNSYLQALLKPSLHVCPCVLLKWDDTSVMFLWANWKKYVAIDWSYYSLKNAKWNKVKDNLAGISKGCDIQ